MTDTKHRRAPQHPNFSTALTLSDIRDGVRYVTFTPQPEGEVVERGTFAGEPEYNETDERWHAPVVVSESTLRNLSGTVEMALLYELGITPAGNGQDWSRRVTIPDDRED